MTRRPGLSAVLAVRLAFSPDPPLPPARSRPFARRPGGIKGFANMAGTVTSRDILEAFCRKRGSAQAKPRTRSCASSLRSTKPRQRSCATTKTVTS